MEFVCQQDTKELNDTSEEQIGLGGEDVGGLTTGNPQRIFQGIDGAFHGGAAVVDSEELIGISGKTGVQP